MKLLKKCSCSYTLKETCPHCSKKTTDAHYKFSGLKDEKEKHL